MTTRIKKRRSKGTGSIIQRPNGSYAYQYRDATGSRRTISLKTKNRKEADKKVSELQRITLASDEIEAKSEIARSRNLMTIPSLPFSGVWTAYLQTGPRASGKRVVTRNGESWTGTLGLYHRALKRFIAWMGNNRPSVCDFVLVDPETAQEYLDQLWASGISASTWNDHRNALGHITGTLARRRKGMANPWPTGKHVRKTDEQQKRHPLSPEQCEKLVESLEEYVGLHEKEIPCMIFLGLYAGMRVADAALLKWENVNLNSHRISYRPIKTAQTSRVTACPPILPALEKKLAKQERLDSEYVLPEIAKHYKRNPDYIRKKLNAIIHAVTGDIRQSVDAQHQRNRSIYGAHSLRHTFATEAAKAGASAAQLKGMIGDTIQTIDRYYAKQDLAEVALPEYEPIPRLLANGSQNINLDRSTLHGLADSLSVEQVRELVALATAQTTSAQ